jgi:hypothetical protein
MTRDEAKAYATRIRLGEATQWDWDAVVTDPRHIVLGHRYRFADGTDLGIPRGGLDVLGHLDAIANGASE